MKLGKSGALLAAVASAFAIGGAAIGTSAASAKATATLSIYAGCESWNGQHPVYWDYLVRVKTTPTNPFANPKLVIRLWGEDEWYDDLISGPYTTFSQQFDFCVNTGTLDEDVGKDDIYAGVRIYDSAGRQIETAETNRIHNYY